MSNEKNNVIDPYDSEKRYLNYTGKNMKNLFSNDKKLIKKFLYDMEKGVNVSVTKKGARSYIRLNALRSRIPKVANWIKEKYNKPITEISSREIIELFDDLNKGKIKKEDGTVYKSVDDYIKDYRSFWNWYIKMMRREKEVAILNIMEDVEDPESDVKEWVYFLPEYPKIRKNAKYYYKVLMDFLLDSGIRTGKELKNVRVRHIEQSEEDESIGKLKIIKEASKTFGRDIKLMNCYPELKKFIKENKLKDNDTIFNYSSKSTNQYLKRLFTKVLGKKTTKAGKKYCDIRLYDFRHNSACFWVPKYKQESILMYRFGWKSNRMIIYYTKFLGHRDTIQPEDMLTDISKTQLEKELVAEKKERMILKDEVKSLRDDLQLLKKFLSKKGVKKAIEEAIE